MEQQHRGAVDARLFNIWRVIDSNPDSRPDRIITFCYFR
jgi:hypothetical protein